MPATRQPRGLAHRHRDSQAFADLGNLPPPVSPSKPAEQSPAAEAAQALAGVTFAPNVTPSSYVDPADASAEPLTEPVPPPSLRLPPDAESPGERGASKARKTKAHPAGHIPRPPNAFMLFRQYFLSHKHTPGAIDSHNNTRLSRLIGLEWRMLPALEREFFFKKAAIKKAEHKQMYPDYRYRPVHKKPRKPKRAPGADAPARPVPLSDEEDDFFGDDDQFAADAALLRASAAPSPASSATGVGFVPHANPNAPLQPPPLYAQRRRSSLPPPSILHHASAGLGANFGGAGINIPRLPSFLVPPGGARAPSPVSSIARSAHGAQIRRTSSAMGWLESVRQAQEWAVHRDLGFGAQADLAFWPQGAGVFAPQHHQPQHPQESFFAQQQGAQSAFDFSSYTLAQPAPGAAQGPYQEVSPLDDPRLAQDPFAPQPSPSAPAPAPAYAFPPHDPPAWLAPQPSPPPASASPASSAASEFVLAAPRPQTALSAWRPELNAYFDAGAPPPDAPLEGAGDAYFRSAAAAQAQVPASAHGSPYAYAHEVYAQGQEQAYAPGQEPAYAPAAYGDAQAPVFNENVFGGACDALLPGAEAGAFAQGPLLGYALAEEFPLFEAADRYEWADRQMRRSSLRGSFSGPATH
ncbi:hypothetical protein WOLCODRAFT_139780 [Wolfiporia cocos MD-104 SS10]|uniref:HMG box domain-containing protein n=1 Tax=Wolfiporia cocos (strain MD-104) TaxID=742152 RepID=A0A2H3J0E7_WOLCO|nr:hypothetical protein WOLCODRAFT_139780 [Wolfiporia cocos MD-104 SS10]